MEPLQILLIEDNLADARLLWEDLNLNGGAGTMQWMWVEKLSEGFEQLAQRPFDAILLDYNLPDSQGLEALQKIQEHAPQIPVVILTGIDDEAVARQAMQAGAQDYLVKGETDIRTVGRAIRHAIERKRNGLALIRRAQELQALYETSLEINTQVSLPTLLQSVVERAVRLVGAPMGGLFVLRSSGKTLRLDYTCNLPPGYLGKTSALGEGLAGRVAQDGHPLAVSDYSQWEGRSSKFENQNFHRALGVPLKVGQNVIGVIMILDDRQTGQFSPEEIRLVSLFADQAAIAFQNASLIEQVQRLATLDDLTGLYNRRGFILLVEKIINLARRSTGEMVLIFLDIDKMKQINDLLGHKAGDQALVETATVMRNTFRAADVLARIGGDEFAVLAYPSTEMSAPLLLARLQAEVQKINARPGRQFLLSISAGCTAWTPDQPASVDTLLSLADQAMYTSKRAKVISTGELILHR